MNSSLSGIVSTFLELRDSEKEFVLATIIEAQGSTYRKAGARLLITRADKFYGLLGGGCFEADLLEHAQQVFEQKNSQTVYYDMRGPEDLIWGLGLGCNGAVRIRLEYLSTENNYTPLTIIQQGLESKQKCVVATICESTHPSLLPDLHFLIRIDQDLQKSESIPEVIQKLANKTFDTDVCSLVKLDIDSHPVEIFMAPVIPPTEFLIIGGGPDSLPVIDTAILLGWSITVVDYRDSYSKQENFPDDVRVIKSTPENLPANLDLAAIDAVILMTHKFEYDLRYLKNFIPTTAPYIGLLGPTARKDELLRSLGDAPAEFIRRIYGPVGLNIGAELPEEIALSLISEIQAVLNNRHGGHLSRDLITATELNIATDLSVIVLAGGGSSRFGALKQLLEYKGKSLLKRIVETALELECKEVLVVHGPKATKCQREISAHDVVNVVNNDWGSGMASSLILALRSISPESKAALVLLCDQPLINRLHLQQLLDLWKQNPEKIVACKYANTVGVPAILPRVFFDEIKKLQGDAGAKNIISGSSECLVSISIPEAEIDIDTEQDFSDLLAQKKHVSTE